ncbi:MAG: alpha-amylase [Muribaculaceae bacterium]|nr:alpha-amylase [Muribaculaceae bacterium]
MKFRSIALAAAAIAAVAVVPSLCAAKKSVEHHITRPAAPQWIENAVIYEANLRQGTEERNLKGLQKRLPALKDLGVDIVWLMPVHPISEKNRKGTLGSYYAVKDYKDVNPEFGTLEDLKEFVRTAHTLGMKVILDEVCNHTGCDNPWVEEHPEYYARNEKGEMYGPFDWTDTYKLDYSNPATVEAMSDALKFWVAEADIDGYRCDVAGQVPVAFWEKIIPELHAIKPVFMLAEADDPELLYSFNADYAWPMKDLFNDIAATQGVNAYAVEKKQNRAEKHAADIPALIRKQHGEYPAGSIHMNMVTNHDLNSWEGTEFERYGEGLGCFAVLSYTLPGMPMMYTGQEVGFNHAFEFFEHDTTPDYTPNQLTSFYEMLNALKHNHSALNASGQMDTMTVWNTTSPDLLVFTREDAQGDKVTVFANLSAQETNVTFTDLAPSADSMVNYFTGAPASMPNHLGPWQFRVWVNE